MRPSERLLQLFERELRDFDAAPAERSPGSKARKPRVSNELDQVLVEYVAEVRTKGSTPEEMLKDLKTRLSRAAPEIPGSQRSAFVASVTGLAIDAFYGSDGKRAQRAPE